MYYFIVNEHGKSGHGRAAWREIKKELTEREIPHKAYLTESKGHGKKIAKGICEKWDEDTRIIVVGGDGTFNEVINGIDDFDRVKLGLIPLGSANDFAKGMGIPQNPMEALEIILSDREPVKIDLGRTTFDGKSRLFAISSGVGIDALVCKMVDKSKVKGVLNKMGLGDKSYGVITVQALFGMKTESVKVEVESKDGDTEAFGFENFIFLAAMNMPAEGGGVPMAPKAKSDNGKLTMVCAHDKTKLQAPGSLIKLLAGKHEDSKEFTLRDFDAVSIVSESPLALHTDGEYLGDYSEVKIRCLPGKMQFIG